MKLHLPLRLLAAVLAVLAMSSAPAATVLVDGTSVTLDAKEYPEGLQVTGTAQGMVTMNTDATKVGGSSTLSLDAAFFVMEKGTLGNGAGTSVGLQMTNGAVFTMGASSSYRPVMGSGNGATVDLNLVGSTMTLASGTLGTGGAQVSLTLGSGSMFELKNGTFSNSSHLRANESGNYIYDHTTAEINVNAGGQFVMNGADGYLGYAGGGAMVYVNDGGVFTQNAGVVSFARGTEGGRVELHVNQGGVYSMKGGTLAASSAKARVYVESGGVFELGSRVSEGADGKVTRTSGQIVGGQSNVQNYADVVVRSGGVFNMSDGGIAVSTTSSSSGKPEARLLVSGSFNQTGGEVATKGGRVLVVVQDGGSYALSSGMIGRDGGAAAVNVRRGGQFTLRGNGEILGDVEIALGYTPDFSVSYKSESTVPENKVWGEDEAPAAEAEGGSYALVQEGGVVADAVRIGLVGEAASYAQSGGEIAGSASVSLSDGASFVLSGEGEITGSASVTVGSGSSFVLGGGSVGGQATLRFADGASFAQSGGALVESAGLELIGGQHTQTGGSISTSGRVLLSEGARLTQEAGGAISGAQLTLAGKGTQLEMEGSITESEINLGAGTSLTQSGGVLGGVLSASEAAVELAGGVTQADLSLTAGSTLEQQAGNTTLGSLVVDASVWTQTGGKVAHGSSLRITGGGSFVQESAGSVDADISVESGSMVQRGVVSGSVGVRGEAASYEQAGGSLTGRVSIETGGSLTQSGGLMDAEVSVSGSGASLVQTGGSIAGTLRATGGRVEQAGSITGDIWLSEGAELQNAGSIAGSVSLGAGASLAQSAGGSITGRVEAADATIAQADAGTIDGDVALSAGASLTQAGGSVITGDVTLDAAGLTQTAGSIGGGVTLRNGATMTQAGEIGGDVVVGSGSAYQQQAGDIGGGVSVDDADFSMAGGDVGGEVVVSNHGSYSQTTGAIGGSVSVTDAEFTHGVGSIGGGVVAVRSVLTHDGGDISGDIELTDSSLTLSSAAIGGNVSAQGSSIYKQTGGSISGSVSSRNGAEVSLSNGVEVSGGVSAEGATFSQTGGSIGGGIVLAAQAGAELEQVSVSGGAKLAGVASLSQREGDVSGDVSVTEGAQYVQSGSSAVIRGNVSIDAASFAMEGAIDGQVSLSNHASFDMKGGSLVGNTIEISGGSVFSHLAGSISGAEILVQDATLDSRSTGIDAAVTLEGSEASYEMHGQATSGSIVMHGGRLAGAQAFDGAVRVDTDAAYSQALDLGGVGAGRISSVNTRSTTALLENVGAGQLTFADAGNMMMVGSQSSDAAGAATQCLISFADGGAGSVGFDGADASLTLHFSANVLRDLKENKKEDLEVWLTNGSLAGAPADVAGLEAWLAQHFVVGSGVLAEDGAGDYGWQGAEGGKLRLRVDTDGIWIASVDADVKTPTDWELYKKSRMVIVDEDMRISQDQESEINVRQLSSGGDHTGNLTIDAQMEDVAIRLINEETVEGSGNGDTQFNGDLIVSGTHADSARVYKTGEGTLSVGGNITGAAGLHIEQGTLALGGAASRVGTLAMESGAGLVLSGGLSLTEDTQLAAGSITGGGLLTQESGRLTLGEGVEVQANLSVGTGAQVERAGAVEGSVTLAGAGSAYEHQDASGIAGDVSLQGQGSVYRHTEAGDIGGDVLLSGAESIFEHGAGRIGGAVSVSGKGAELTHAGDIAGKLSLSGEGARYASQAAGEIGGGVELSGLGAQMQGAQVSVVGDVVITGDQAAAQVAQVQGGATLRGAGSELTAQKVTGLVELAGEGAKLLGLAEVGGLSLSGDGTQASAQVWGDVVATGENAVLDGMGPVAGSVTLSGAGALYKTAAAGIGDDLAVSGAGSVVQVGGDVGGEVVVSAESAQVEVGGVVGGSVLLSGAEASYTQGGDTLGSVVVAGRGASYAQAGLVGGDVQITGEGARYEIAPGGEISGGVLLAGRGALLDLGDAATVAGEIDLQAGALAQAGGYAGAGVRINTTAEQQGELQLGGLRAERVLSVTTGSGVRLVGLAAGSSLSFAGVNSMFVGRQSVSYGDDVASAALVEFDAAGSVGFADGGQLKLRFEDELRREFASGTMEIWLTSGVLSGAPVGDEAALLAWLREHILLATGAGLEFALESADFAGARDGWLSIQASSADVWQTTEQSAVVKDPGVFGSYSKVDIDADTTLDVAGAEDSRAVMRQLTGGSRLSIRNSGSGELTVELRNEDMVGYYGETTFGGDIIVAPESSGSVRLEKTGNAELRLAGKLQTPGSVSVKDGQLTLLGEGSSIGSIALGGTREDGTPGEGALVVDGSVELTGESDLRAAAGSISGQGLILLSGGLTLGEGVSLSGPALWLDEDGALRINGVKGSALAALSGSGTLDLGREGDLSVGGGSFSGVLAGSGTLRAVGKGAQLELHGPGSADYDLVVGANAAVTLQEQAGAIRAATGREIAWRSITNAGTLAVQSADGQATLRATGDITLAAGSSTQICLNVASPSDAALESTGGRVLMAAGSGLELALVGRPSGETLSITLIRSAEGVCDEAGELLSSGAELANVSFNESIFDLLYADAAVVVDEGSKTVSLIATQSTENKLQEKTPSGSRNSRVGAELIWEAVKVADPAENPTLMAVSGAVTDLLAQGQGAAAERTMAAVAGSTVTTLGAAQRDALREQLGRMRDLAAGAEAERLAGRSAGTQERVHAYVQATGSYAKLNADGDEAGYKLSSWGGSVGADIAAGKSTTVGLALSALYGDLDATAADTATGSLDSYYLSLMLRHRSEAWTHALVLTLGANSAELNRTVDYGSGSYTTHGSTDGVGVGALYEVTRDVALNAQGTSILQPLFAASLASTSMKGYEETGADGAGLRVADQKWTTLSLSLGARWLRQIDARVFGREALAELRLSLSQDLGDTAGEAGVGLLANPGFTRTVYGAEVGPTALQLGAGLTIPVGARACLLFNGGGELRSGASSWTLSAGVRMSF